MKRVVLFCRVNRFGKQRAESSGVGGKSGVLWRTGDLMKRNLLVASNNVADAKGIEAVFQPLEKFACCRVFIYRTGCSTIFARCQSVDIGCPTFA